MFPEQEVSNADLLEIVFADRNKAYGAYQLRRNYPGYLARALGTGLPRWSPGEANGHAVKVRFVLPVRFALR